MLLFLMFSCYDEYVKDFDYNGVYFPNPVNVRTVVVGEGLKIRVGAEIGGILENTKDRNVNFIIDNLKKMSEEEFKTLEFVGYTKKEVIEDLVTVVDVADKNDELIYFDWF